MANRLPLFSANLLLVDSLHTRRIASPRDYHHREALHARLEKHG